MKRIFSHTYEPYGKQFQKKHRRYSFVGNSDVKSKVFSFLSYDAFQPVVKIKNENGESVKINGKNENDKVAAKETTNSAAISCARKGIKKEYKNYTDGHNASSIPVENEIVSDFESQKIILSNDGKELKEFKCKDKCKYSYNNDDQLENKRDLMDSLSSYGFDNASENRIKEETENKKRSSETVELKVEPEHDLNNESFKVTIKQNNKAKTTGTVESITTSRTEKKIKEKHKNHIILNNKYDISVNAENNTKSGHKNTASSISNVKSEDSNYIVICKKEKLQKPRQNVEPEKSTSLQIANSRKSKQKDHSGIEVVNIKIEPESDLEETSVQVTEKQNKKAKVNEPVHSVITSGMKKKTKRKHKTYSMLDSENSISLNTENDTRSGNKNTILNTSNVKSGDLNYTVTSKKEKLKEPRQNVEPEKSTSLQIEHSRKSKHKDHSSIETVNIKIEPESDLDERSFEVTEKQNKKAKTNETVHSVITSGMERKTKKKHKTYSMLDSENNILLNTEIDTSSGDLYYTLASKKEKLQQLCQNVEPEKSTSLQIANSRKSKQKDHSGIEVVNIKIEPERDLEETSVQVTKKQNKTAKANEPVHFVITSGMKKKTKKKHKTYTMLDSENNISLNTENDTRSGNKNTILNTSNVKSGDLNYAVTSKKEEFKKSRQNVEPEESTSLQIENSRKSKHKNHSSIETVNIKSEPESDLDERSLEVTEKQNKKAKTNETVHSVITSVMERKTKKKHKTYSMLDSENNISLNTKNDTRSGNKNTILNTSNVKSGDLNYTVTSKKKKLHEPHQNVEQEKSTSLQIENSKKSKHKDHSSIETVKIKIEPESDLDETSVQVTDKQNKKAKANEPVQSVTTSSIEKKIKKKHKNDTMLDSENISLNTENDTRSRNKNTILSTSNVKSGDLNYTVTSKKEKLQEPRQNVEPEKSTSLQIENSMKNRYKNYSSINNPEEELNSDCSDSMNISCLNENGTSEYEIKSKRPEEIAKSMECNKHKNGTDSQDSITLNSKILHESEKSCNIPSWIIINSDSESDNEKEDNISKSKINSKKNKENVESLESNENKDEMSKDNSNTTSKSKESCNKNFKIANTPSWILRDSDNESDDEEVLPSSVAPSCIESLKNHLFTNHSSEVDDIEYLLKMKKESEKLSLETIEQLQKLRIKMRHKVPPQHRIETHAGSRVPTHEQKQHFEIFIPIKNGPFSPEEDQIIVKNWKAFCKLHNWDKANVRAFLYMKHYGKFYISQFRERQKFVQFLANGLPWRTLYSVYHRFRNLFQKRVVQRYKSIEDSCILTYIDHNPNVDSKRMFSDLAKLLNRTRSSVWRHYQLLKLKQQND